MAFTPAAVVIPARNEAPTIAAIAGVVQGLVERGVVAELVVVDDGSRDATAATARDAGARVVANRHTPGKGGALRTGLACTDADPVLFLDGDVTGFHEGFVTGLLSPLHDPAVAMVKPRYQRDWRGHPGEGGRVTELLARPLLARWFPEVADLAQPLAGETAIRRTVVESVGLADGYGVEVALLLDVCAVHGRAAIAEVDLGQRHHRNRPLADLRPHADAVLGAVWDRVEQCGWGARSRQGQGAAQNHGAPLLR